ncbi:MAG: hypothetical protein EBV03_07300 [Proteobacteria bacterium]|nr:hypothetical protein [Pseudomonadota bacterium]
MNALQKHAKKALYYCIGGWLAGTLMAQRLPDTGSLKNPVYDQPLQQEGVQPEFHFTYKGEDVRVVPLAKYRIAGLVVSHNDPEAWYRFDITHDSKSLNTRDICLVWGENLRSGQYKRVNFHNDDYSCLWSYGKDLGQWNDHEVSNNHLITANDDIRKQINRLSIGDQVVITGRLASYAEAQWGANAPLRQTSLRRDDTGNGACEIILVEGLEVIASHNWVWTGLRDLCRWIITLIIAGHVAVFLMPRKRAQKTMVKPQRWGMHK